MKLHLVKTSLLASRIAAVIATGIPSSLMMVLG